jgi:N-acetylmuramoyl-L-alanine amidase
MPHFVKTASATAFGLFSLAAIAATTPGVPAWAADMPDAVQASLLPDSVKDAAAQETTSSQYSLIPWPEANERQNFDTQDTGRSLSELVARHASTQTLDREHECLATATYFESKGEPLDGQLAVAQTILNRAHSGRFASTVCGVVLQPGQFSFVRGGGFPSIARSSIQWKQAVAISSIAREGLKKSSVGNALFFHARYVSPGWHLTRLASVGNHVFYR